MPNDEPLQTDPGLSAASQPDDGNATTKEFQNPDDLIIGSDQMVDQTTPIDRAVVPPAKPVGDNRHQAEVFNNTRQNTTNEHPQSKTPHPIDFGLHQDTDYYELQAVAQWFGKSTSELSTLMHENLKAFCDYGHAIIEHQKAFGEKLTTQQQAFELVNAFLQEHLIIHRDEMKAPVEGNAYTIFDTAGNHYIVEGTTSWLSGSVRTSFRFSYKPCNCDLPREAWLVSPFVINNEDSTGYTITECTTIVEGFDTQQTIKSRKLTDKDIERLREVVKGFVGL
jgi:hypothetical protein